jgi:hypothetical protein
MPGKFVHEDNRNACACLFDMESYPVFREDYGHLRLRIVCTKDNHKDCLYTSN